MISIKVSIRISIRDKRENKRRRSLKKYQENIPEQGWPGGTVVKFVCSAAVAQG